MYIIIIFQLRDFVLWRSMLGDDVLLVCSLIAPYVRKPSVQRDSQMRQLTNSDRRVCLFRKWPYKRRNWAAKCLANSPKVCVSVSCHVRLRCICGLPFKIAHEVQAYVAWAHAQNVTAITIDVFRVERALLGRCQSAARHNCVQARIGAGLHPIYSKHISIAGGIALWV